MIALYIILYGGLTWGFYMIYELLRYQYGDKVTKYLLEQRWRAKVLRDYERIQFERKEKIVRSMEPVECEIEEVSWDDVIYRNDSPKRTPKLIVLEINKPLKIDNAN
jgi:hypothetical protein